MTNPQSPAPVPSSAVTQQLDSLDKQIVAIREVLQCRITRLTIVVAGRDGFQSVNKVFSFPSGSIPGEIHNFLQDYGNRLCAEKLTIQSEIVLIKLGDQVLELESFIKEYTAGLTPSIDADSAAALRALDLGGICSIIINNIPFPVKRIN